MKNHTKRICSLALVLVLLCALIPLQASAYTVTTDVIIEAKYDAAEPFNDGYAAVKVGENWGFIDESGNMVVQPKYAWVTSVSEGHAIAAVCATMEDPWTGEEVEDAMILHLIDMKGKEIPLIDRQYSDWISNNWGDEVSVPIYIHDLDRLESMTSQTFWWGCFDGIVFVNGRVFDTSGNAILPTNTDTLFVSPYEGAYDWFTACGPSHSGLIPMQAGYFAMGGQGVTNQCFLMDHEGTIVKTFTPAYDMETEACGTTYLYAPNGDRIAVSQEIKEANYYGENNEYVEYWSNDNVWGIMDLEGNWIVEPFFYNFYANSDGTYFRNGYMSLQDKASGLWGVIDTNGNTVIPFEYEEVSFFDFGYAAARKDGRYVFLDTAGNSYEIAALDGGIANVTFCTGFSEMGIAAVYDADSETCYCVSYDAMNGIMPVVHGSEELDFNAYFLDTDGDGKANLMTNPEELIVITQNGKCGYSKLELGYLNPFTDLDPKKFYFTPVLWAVDKGITTGKTATEFQPNGDCTRAQIVTFLWRANGEPEPTLKNNPFTDVKESAYYYKAVLWAVEKGITTGKTATTFEPTSPCTRAQVVTFLWRSAGKPEPQTETIPFTDVGGSAYYYDAVIWAGEENITKGQTATTFAPTNTCTRGHIVTFLYRFIVE